MKQNGDKMTMLNDDEIFNAVGGTARGNEWKFQGMTYYRVAQGDSLSDIARRFNTSSEAIKALNPVLIKNFGELHAGMELRVL